MNISQIALKIWAVHNTTSRITTRKSFHDNWNTEDEFLAMMSDITNIDDVVHDLSVAVDDARGIGAGNLLRRREGQKGCEEAERG